MSQFLNSVIRQLGRDTGKVLSNAVFKDAHSTPIRMARGGGSNQVVSRETRTKARKTEFEKALIFDRSANPKTLTRKIQALSVILDEELSGFMDDDYLSAQEANAAFKMLNDFSSKAESVAKQLQIDEEGNTSEISQLEKIVKQTYEDFHKVLRMAADGCEKIIPKMESNYEKKRFKFFRWVILNTFYMRNYAKTGEKNIMKTVLANILLIGSQPLMMLFGLITAPIEWNNRREESKLYKAAVKQEQERAKTYREIIA